VSSLTVTNLHYDVHGRQTQVINSVGEITTMTLDGTGATGSVVRVDFGYDHRGEQTTITWFSNLY
jgi:hypothetical protein